MSREQTLSLKHFIPPDGLEPSAFLDLTQKITAELAKLHHKRCIHKRINAYLIKLRVFQGQIKALWLEDSPDKHLDDALLDNLSSPAVIQHLPYMSPEQTGRMNQVVDERSDLYSLGTVLFEMASGRLPFPEQDPMRLVHSQIAKAPPALNEIKPQWPGVLSTMIGRLLAKSASKRYKSCRGLLKDLAHCSTQLKGQTIDDFELGAHDHYETFHIPNKLYGRAIELENLEKRFSLAARENKQIVLLSGHAGTGKTALFDAFAQSITPHAMILKGKFDQLGNGSAYSAVGEAFQGLAKEFLMKSDADLAIWRDKLNTLWGDDGGFITDLVPGFVYIAGEQPDIPVLQPEEVQMHFFQVFGRFVSAFASEQQPLVLFLDDLQWADPGSLELLEYLAQLKLLKHLLFIFAYRDNEIEANLSAEKFLKRLFTIGIPVSSFSMKPLVQDQVEEMIKDCLDSASNSVGGLAEFVLQKTDGNAFFVSRFLLSLYQDQLLAYKAENECWSWDLEEIRSRTLSGNVVELMARKIQQLDPQTQNIMQLAAILGNQFETSQLMIIANRERGTVLNAVRQAISAGFFLSQPNGFRFVHDRIQEAAYLSIPIELRATRHLEIARLLLSRLEEETEQQEWIFDIARHYLHSLDLLENEEEKKAVAKHLLRAAMKSIQSAAWETALLYIDAAINKLLATDSWSSDFDLTWNLFKHKAYCEYTTAQLEQSENTVKICMAHAQTERQHVDLHTLYSRLLFQMNRHEEGIKNAKAGLAKLGIAIPARINKLNVLVEFARFRWHLKRRPAKDLMNIEPLRDEHLINVCRMLYDTVESSYVIAPMTMAYFSLMMANICIKHGHSIYSPFAYVMVSMAMTGVSKEFQRADELSKMAIELNKAYPDKGVKGRIYTVTLVSIWHWCNPIGKCDEMIETALQCSVETGSMHYAYGEIVFTRPQSFLFNDETLDQVIARNEDIHQQLKQYQDRESLLQQEHLLDFCYWLTGSTPSSDHVQRFDQAQYRSEMRTEGNGVIRAYFHCYESYRSFLQCDYLDALARANEAWQYVDDTLGNLICAPIYLLYILSYLKCRENPSDTAAVFGPRQHFVFKAAYLQALRALKKIARHNPTEFNALYLLCEAERSRFRHKPEEAIRLYDEAITAANSSGYGFIKALSLELTSDYYLDNGALSAAKHYKEQAIDCYQQWGAKRKVEQLHQSDSEALSLPHLDADSHYPVAKGGLSLDIEAIIQASQVLSREIEINQLLSKLMSIVITIAGAEKGHLVLAINDALFLRATAAEDSERVTTWHDEPIDSCDDIAEGVVHYVYRTGETLLLGNAVTQGSFRSEPYIASEGVKSLICLPMLRQDKVIGVLYLENRLLENAFTEQHLSILNAILSQASISLENAELFEQRKQNLNELKQLSLAVEQSPVAITITDKKGLIEYVNAFYLSRSGYTKDEVIGQNMLDIQLQGLNRESRASLFDDLEAGSPWFKELMSQDKNGETYWERITLSPVLSADRAIQNILLISEDITKRKEQEAKILYQAQFDALTDLPNRILATDRLNQAMSSAQRNRKKCALLFIDLDDFKKINDTEGHEIGDLLLKSAAQRLKGCIRESDTVARQGGDEFIIILKDIEQAIDAEAIAEQIIRAFNQPFELHHMQAVVTASIGIAFYPDDGTDVNTLLRNADAAMYQAKESGRNTECFFDAAVNRKALRKLKLERHLRSALEQQEFELYYQPVYNVSNNRIIGAEALLRWNSQALGTVSNEEYIPVAEQTGLIVDIGLWVLDQACAAGRKFREHSNDPFTISVNVSPRQFRDSSLISSFTETLSHTGYPVQNLAIEVTEGLFLDATQNTITQLQTFKSMGANISMDDFGTGYSSLNYLRRYPFDILKIDRSFVAALNGGKESQELVKAAIAMARALSLKVIAEGVENEEQQDFIRASGCDYAQGYYFSKPVTEPDFEALLLGQ